jgi:outer membrane protease
MGLNIRTLNMIYEVLDILEIYKFKGLNICELGNLQIRKDVHPFLKANGIPLYKSAKEYFTHIGFNDTSIDWNGKDGALSLDLGKPINNKFNKKFDILINGGTTEHVYNQYECWKNIHNICKENAVIFSVGPLAGNWLKHSPYRYSLEFFEHLSIENNYDLLEKKVVNFKKKKGFDCHYISFKKNGGEFISEELFIKIWNNHNEEIKNGTKISYTV